jgi:hypothetical protein
MRIYPPVTVEETIAWLKREAQEDGRFEMTPQFERSLLPLAEAMAAVSRVVLSEEVEPFGP